MDDADPALATVHEQPQGVGTFPERRLGQPMLAELVAASIEGIAVLDAKRRYVYVNPAGCEILGSALASLTGRRSTEFDNEAQASAGAPGLRSITLVQKNGERQLEFAESSFTAEGRTLPMITFRDVTEASNKERQLRAFARTASSFAYARSVTDLLNQLADEVRQATGIAACTVVLVDAETGEVREVGTAGGNYPDDYATRLEQARRLGAPLAVMRALTSRDPVIRRNWQSAMARDPRYAPIWQVIESSESGAFVAVPLAVRDHVIGSLIGAYRTGRDPSENEIAFLTAMADQAALAIENARLVAKLESKAALEERHRLARELHDSIAQALFSLTLTTRAIELAHQQSGPDQHGRVGSGLAEIRELTQGVLAEMRALIFHLRPGALHEEGLVSAVSKQAAAVAAKRQLTVRVDGPQERVPLTEETEQELFRVVQEALNNAAKHAQANKVTIRFGIPDGQPRSLVIDIVDDGVGFDPAAPHPGHFGLTTMRERVERIGGTLTVTSHPGRSTTVHASISNAIQPTPQAAVPASEARS